MAGAGLGCAKMNNKAAIRRMMFIGDAEPLTVTMEYPWLGTLILITFQKPV
jgi:hypothetical protein